MNITNATAMDQRVEASTDGSFKTSEQSSPVYSNGLDVGESSKHLPHRHSPVADALESPDHGALAIENAEELTGVSVAASVLELPEPQESLPTTAPERHAAKPYAQYSIPMLTALMGPSVFGVLARLGLLAITSYDQHSIFPLAWVQGAGCLVMGFALGWKEPISA
jgi:hypothetical protein